MSSNIEYSTNSIKLKVLAANLSSHALVIPPHQRDFVWTKKSQRSLVETIMMGIPIPAVTIRKQLLKDGTTLTTLEDGQQRLTTLRLFMEDAFADEHGRYFSHLSEITKEKFRSYLVPVTTYENATDSEAIEIFMRLQMGSVLSIGERLHAVKDKAPLVAFAQEMLLTPGKGFYDRTVPFWGDFRTPKTNRGAHTTTAVVICLALAKKNSSFLTKEGLNPKDIADVNDFDKNEITYYLEQIISIFERVHELQPVTTSTLKKHYWDTTNYIGYIIHGLLMDDTKLKSGTIPFHDEQIQRWVDFMVRQRSTPSILEDELHCGDKAKGGHITLERWHRGWLRMFPEVGELIEVKSDHDSEEESP